MLVCVGSTLIMIVSAFADVLGSSEHIVLDPSRIAAQVVSGIGFLGRPILLRGEIVRGLTTAASLGRLPRSASRWAAGFYVASISATIIILIIPAGIAAGAALLHGAPAAPARADGRGRHAELRFAARGARPDSARVKQFIVQRADDTGEHDEVRIALARVSELEYQAICAARAEGRHAFRRGQRVVGRRIGGIGDGHATMADRRFRSTSGSALAPRHPIFLISAKYESKLS